jgi:hypothetical protein
MQHGKDQCGEKETKKLLQKILHGAFSGPPTPLKDLPTREGESRRIGRKRPKTASAASARTASRGKKNRA